MKKFIGERTFSENTRLRIFSGAIVTLLMFGIFIMSLNKTKSLDSLPIIAEITPEKKDELGPFVAVVDTGFYLRSFPEFDVVKNQFEIDGVVWFQFNPLETMLSTVERFSFLNGKIKRKSGPDIKRVGQDIFVKYEVRFELLSDLNFKYFPYTSHKLPIMLINPYVTPREVIFKSSDSNFNMSRDIDLSNWKVTGRTAKAGYISEFLDQSEKNKKELVYPVTLFGIDFKKDGIKHHIILLVPILFGLLLALFSFLIPYKVGVGPEGAGTMINLSSAAVASLLAYNFVIQSLIPAVGYMTTTDLIYMLSLLISFVPFALHIFFVMAISRTSSPWVVYFINTIGYFAFVVLSLISIVTLFYLTNF